MYLNDQAEVLGFHRNGEADDGDTGAFRNAEFDRGAFGALVLAEEVVGVVGVLQPDGRGEGHSAASAQDRLRPESAQDRRRFEVDHDPIFTRSGFVSAPSAFRVQAHLLLRETFIHQITISHEFIN